ncbi:putative RING finger protein P32A8.03c [Colletotrichum chlorophyti]|uniref:RING-type E3 ubiquitin transferase n=1 Tax=Colletotrichum chlorophyti TaxID=708187 RepID=A0A1Q8S2Z8_9PEZI|nr:putative RING finger protein P32A8.03c [Colletotrichum chlorophyti]
MESHNTRGGHLDATAGREVVYCHACSHEWWQDEHGLQCPRCESEITEIVCRHEDLSTGITSLTSSQVSPDNDPRLIEDGPPLHDFPGHRPRLDDDSDPEEADIEEHLHRGPSGFVLHRTIWDNSQRPGQSPSPSTRQPPDANDGDQIIRRFIDMVNDFGMGMPPRSPEEPTRAPGIGGFFGGGGNVRHYHRAGPGGTTSFTIATGPIHIHPGGSHSPVGPGSDPFQSYVGLIPRSQRPPGPRITIVSLRPNANHAPSIFSSVLSGGGPPQAGGIPAAGQGQRGAGGAPAILHELLNMLNPANASHGDAVYTQEALDRIISTLMEQNPQSNAAPPATEDALNKLQRKKVDKEMLGPDGKTECTICIDDFKEGDDATVLPCKHWFHDQCVVMWLKEHNTCPICRTPIEEPSSRNNNDHGNASGSDNSNSNNNNSTNNDTSQRGPDAAPVSSGNSRTPYDLGDAPPGMPGHWGAPNFANRPFFAYGAPPVPADSTRPQRSPMTDWDVPFPLYGGAYDGRDDPRNADLPPRPQQSSRTPSFRYRRDSHSPPSLRRNMSDSFRARQRSPSSGNWDRDRDANQDSGSNHGPLNWLRNQFSRGSGSGDNSNNNDNNGNNSNLRERRRP